MSCQHQATAPSKVPIGVPFLISWQQQCQAESGGAHYVQWREVGGSTWTTALASGPADVWAVPYSQEWSPQDLSDVHSTVIRVRGSKELRAIFSTAQDPTSIDYATNVVTVQAVPSRTAVADSEAPDRTAIAAAEERTAETTGDALTATGAAEPRTADATAPTRTATAAGKGG